MEDREKQIKEMSEIIKADYKEWLDITGCLPQGTTYYYECLGGGEDCAKKLYDAGFRKMDEVTLRIDLGDRSPEEINEIMGKFSKAAETSSCVAVPNNDKETPQCVTHESSIYTDFTCPRCKNVVSKREKWGDTNVRIRYKYCPFCGQHLKGENE